MAAYGVRRPAKGTHANAVATHVTAGHLAQVAGNASDHFVA
ncbi:hypothetical protein [[Mycobacterium] zoologicum]|nr:hypothetical protein [Mycolicibacter sp. MYC101]MEB3064446.1 hypothetical protein [Mycolicibacter sp. MYC101]